MANIKISPARQMAITVLYQVNEKGGYANLLLPKRLDKGKLSRRDRALATELVYGTLRWQKKIDWIIKTYSKRPLERLDPWVHNILRLGVYQILFLDRIPPRAACYETVQLVKHYGNKGSVAFVNGILRSILRRDKKLQFPNREKEPAAHLSVLHSHPLWLVKRWLSRWGYSQTQALLTANNQHRPLGIRVNTLKNSPRELMKHLEDEGLSFSPGRYFSDALSLNRVPDLREANSFRSGLFQIQDEASQFAARVLDPRPGEKILDACAAPGGKTTHIAQLMKDSGRILATDTHSHKLALIRDNCRRLGIKSVDVLKKDAREWSSADKFHRILVDAPCSGTGVLGRRPDLRWKKSPDIFRQLPILQREILQGVAPLLLPGGTLLYSTCSLEPEENLEVIRSFLQTEPSFCLEDISPYLPQGLEFTTAREGYIQLYPHLHQVDGFFLARMVRK